MHPDSSAKEVRALSKDVFKSVAEIERAEKRKEEALEKKNSGRRAKERRRPERPSGSRKKVTVDEILELIKNTFIILAITVVAGGILGLVYEKTKDPIAAMELKTRQNACRKVFLNAADFSDSVIDSVAIADDTKAKFKGVDIKDCIEALGTEGELLGYVIEVVSHEGYGGDIDFYVGISLDGTVNGISFIEISETAGLGMRADEVLSPQFKNRFAEEFRVTKSGASSVDEIDAISSATITSKAVTGGVNAALIVFRESLEGGAKDE